ncbi:hypothetical protein HHL16_12670 [Pseudoflavitalea sp. G-6-1-2]|uniref:hypothetical protein n=1 Tax=Pseudoflavitalea sp. G-6-1-2 TaxID=2728841 RepID=UPI00146F3A01|nr:hypothetical protein [Pseudoflavitalea sp. G-6-1-2]NML21736.1 hypothetical protein [Pseudoflavitalea sp. G-6-1-2]
MNYKLDFYTQYHQFYLRDKEGGFNTGDVDFWTEEAFQSRLAIGNGVLGIGIECYGPFVGELSILKEKSAELDLSLYDHVVEGGIQIRSGIIQVVDCPNSNIELEVKINPGFYRVRVYSMNLASVEGDSGNDSYKIEIWPETNMECVVIKNYERP